MWKKHHSLSNCIINPIFVKYDRSEISWRWVKSYLFKILVDPKYRPGISVTENNWNLNPKSQQWSVSVSYFPQIPRRQSLQLLGNNNHGGECWLFPDIWSHMTLSTAITMILTRNCRQSSTDLPLIWNICQQSPKNVSEWTPY